MSKNVGILGLHVYTPKTYVSQAALEQHNGVSQGKYTLGLGQTGVAVTGDAEDINSICLTAVHGLLERFEIDPMSVARLEVGTETLVDKSKSTKTVLMDLFPGNTDMEGATVVNACYGGTAALLNAVAHVESDSWESGKFAIVVAADIAAYAAGPARPTCGVGAVAVLVGRNAPLVLDGRFKATHASNVWDFYKPDPHVEYPTVDGALSQSCYYRALEDVYTRFLTKCEKHSTDVMLNATTVADYFCFHAPYNKLVQKSFARLFLVDAQRRHNKLTTNGTPPPELAVEDEKKTENINGNHRPEPENWTEVDASLKDWIAKSLPETDTDKGLEKVLKQLSADQYKAKLGQANAASRLIGNTYTASVFFGLASLLDQNPALPEGTKIGMFSYGSGAMATMYRLTVREAGAAKFRPSNWCPKIGLMDRLQSTRVELKPAELDWALETRARMHSRKEAAYTPSYPSSLLFPGTYYLKKVDGKFRRTYERVPLDAAPAETTAYAPPEIVTWATAKLNGTLVSKQTTTKACFITGTAAGLPGQPQVFDSNNLNRLLQGTNCITAVPPETKQSMLDKHVVQVVKHKDAATGKMTLERVPVDSDAKVIQLAAQLGDLNLTTLYGVPPGLAQTMDVAAQVAVAAGLEALKDAGLVKGDSPEAVSWELAEPLRDSTGVVYASSFPAMDAAVGEVLRFFQSQQNDARAIIAALRSRMIQTLKEGETALSNEDEAAFARLLQTVEQSQTSESPAAYEFDRKFLFRVLVLGNAQLAQVAKCRGPNTQTNAACAGTTQAISLAQDWLGNGRAQRVVVVAGDNASGNTLLPWLGSGFRALGAACVKDAVEDAALPFDVRRCGLLLGAGGIGMVLETEESLKQRNATSCKARLLHTQYSNSAFHGAALERNHIASELQRFLSDVEQTYGISKSDIAEKGVYFSHETCTHASSASSCAGNEIAALRQVFGDDLLQKLLLLNTKGFTGHPMGVSFEDVAAVQVLLHQAVPAVSNYQQPDEYLGQINVCRQSGPYECQYALRFAAGFGSQVAFCLYETTQKN